MNVVVMNDVSREQRPAHDWPTAITWILCQPDDGRRWSARLVDDHRAAVGQVCFVMRTANGQLEAFVRRATESGYFRFEPSRDPNITDRLMAGEDV